MTDQVIEGLRNPGDVCYFEYHCWESPESGDAQLWYRSHQQVTVVELAQNDGYYPPAWVKPIYSQLERFECGVQIVYRVRFPDGHLGHAFEDELLDDPASYERPDPPKPPAVSFG